MALLEGKTPAERNKTIAAIVLGGLALISVSYMMFGSSAPAKKSATANSNSKANASTAQVAKTPVPEQVEDAGVLEELRPIDIRMAQPSIPEAGRNIFAYYEGPPPTPTPTPGAALPLPPTPTPTPPNLLVASISPVNVYARTGDFTLEVAGDKFTPAVRVEINGAEVPTRYINAQQLTASVPGGMISFEGPRQISVRSADSQLFSNTATLNVQAPPTPNYAFVGVLAKRSSNDTALLKDKASRDLLSVQRGDVLGGRFRVTSISEREVALIDTTLKIKHTLPLTTDSSSGNTPGVQSQPASGFPNPNQRYTPPPQGEDDEEP
ncbi:MAG TPA: IPT/TIG domain-containing protein [Pyrinomonadaceae bacterium]